MLNYFTFDGVMSKDYGVYISGNGTYNSPERVYTNISIPGRDGDLLSTETRLRNVALTYPAGIVANFDTNLANLRSKLLSTIGYARLTDTYHPGEYRMAVYKGGLEPEMVDSLVAGQFDITFECKPQRWLLAGEDDIEMDDGDTITNPTLFDARPLIRVTGYGEMQIGSQVITIAQNNLAYIDIDSEMMDCYCGSTNANSYVSFADNDFPILHAGQNGVEFDNTITSVIITPHWWRV